MIVRYVYNNFRKLIIFLFFSYYDRLPLQKYKRTQSQNSEKSPHMEFFLISPLKYSGMICALFSIKTWVIT